MYRLKKEAIFCVKSDMQEDSKTVEKKTERVPQTYGSWSPLCLFIL